MESTLEIRWFREGAPPSEAVDWIRSLGAETAPTRKDLYLVTAKPEMNIKMREGMAQVKLRFGEPVPVSLTRGVKGIQELWKKWSSPLTEKEDIQCREYPDGLWLPVQKKRTQLKIARGDQSFLFSELVNPKPKNVGVEITELHTKYQEAWTICVEAEGEVESLPDNLERAGEILFANNFPLQLSTDSSFAYPEWIRQLL